MHLYNYLPVWLTCSLTQFINMYLWYWVIHVCARCHVLQHYHDSYATYRRVVATFVLGVEAYHQEKYI